MGRQLLSILRKLELHGKCFQSRRCATRIIVVLVGNISTSVFWSMENLAVVTPASALRRHAARSATKRTFHHAELDTHQSIFQRPPLEGGCHGKEIFQSLPFQRDLDMFHDLQTLQFLQLRVHRRQVQVRQRQPVRRQVQVRRHLLRLHQVLHSITNQSSVAGPPAKELSWITDKKLVLTQNNIVVINLLLQI